MPNPARGSASFTLTLPRPGFARARLYDVRGRSVRTLFDRPDLAAGTHTFAIDRRDDRGMVLPAGLYFYRLESEHGTRTGRFALID